MADLKATHSRKATGGKDEWETPPDLFNLLNQEFEFAWDVCATANNTKCLHWFSPEEDGLREDWSRIYGWAWMNPPYSTITKWMAKTHNHVLNHDGRVCVLTAARTDTRWWWGYAIHYNIRFLPGRLRFIGPDGKVLVGAPFPSALIFMQPRASTFRPTVQWWDWKKNEYR